MLAEEKRISDMKIFDVAVIGGGPAGLAAASIIKKKAPNSNVTILEASGTFGGRVKSDRTADGFTLDRGFAVFIDSYVQSRKLLRYDDLKLQPFQPGAFVVTSGGWKKGVSRGGDDGQFKLSRVSDPMRRPQDLVSAVLSPVGLISDKAKLLPLLFHVSKNDVPALFEEPETDTLTALKSRWGFSDQFICQFFEPFLGGVYLSPLKEQSSRMFHFIFKMFSEGQACLPENGMSAIPSQLEEELENWRTGLELSRGTKVTGIDTLSETEGGDSASKSSKFLIKTSKGDLKANQVIVATSGPHASALLHGGKSEHETVQRSVGCLYYAFEGDALVPEPILILNGGQEKGTVARPINNMCFPSVVSPSYAPSGSQLCSVSVLGPTMDKFRNADNTIDGEKLDSAVRKHLELWFPDSAYDILNNWRLLKINDIKMAQPAQYGGDSPANVYKGRALNTLNGKALDDGILVCGDHMATATLDGAFATGVAAGKEAASNISKM